MENLLAGRNVFSSGAGAGRGRSLALEMAAQDANICFVEINRERRTALERERNDLGAQGYERNDLGARGYVCDVSQPGTIAEGCESLNAHSVVTDASVKNVGINSRIAQFGNDFSASDSFENW